MVHSLVSILRRRSTAATFVVFALALVPSRVAAQLQGDTAAALCAKGASESDLVKGLHLVYDPRCATEHGDGCIDDICRYCKSTSILDPDDYPSYVYCVQLADDELAVDPDPAQDTVWCAPIASLVSAEAPASMLVELPAAPAFAPIRGPSNASPPVQVSITRLAATDTECPFAVSSGDFVAGIQLVGDASCAAGGVGCVQNVCRYCQFGPATLQSSGFVACADLGFDFDSPPPVATGLDPNPAPSPATIPDPPVDFTPTPDVSPSVVRAADSTTNCTFSVSEGDLTAGIQLVGDATCSTGAGRGCFQHGCRYCKFRNTAQSKHLVACSDIGYPQFGTPDPTDSSNSGCPYDVSIGDAAVGIILVGDASCAIESGGGLGCFENVCRYCKVRQTPKSAHLLDCEDVVAGRTQATTWTPTDVEDPALPPNIVDLTATPDTTVLTYSPTDGDVPPAPVALTTVAPAPTKAVKPTPPNPVAPRTTKPAASKSPSPTTPLATSKPPPIKPVTPPKSITTIKPVATPTFKPKPRAPASTTVTTTATGCVFLASPRDILDGVQLVGDATCARGGNGCFRNVCRYCQFKKTGKSNKYVTCASLGYSFGSVPLAVAPPPVQTKARPVAASLAPVVTAAIAPVQSIDCPYVVSGGDFAVGIKLVADASCVHGGLGCFQKVCRYCKFKETVQSAHWMPCPAVVIRPVVAPATAPPPTTSQPTMPPSITPIVSDDAVPPDVAVATAPPPPITPAVGPLAPVVVTSSAAPIASSPTTNAPVVEPATDGLDDDTVPPTIASSDTVLPSEIGFPSEVDVTPASCDGGVAIKDVLDGIDIVPDRSCLDGARNCIPNSACRYCMRWVTEASQELLPCADIPPVSVGVTLASMDTSTEGSLDELLQDKTFQWAIVTAACVGVVSVVALITLAAKRAVTRCAASSEVLEDEDKVATAFKAAKVASTFRSALMVVTSDTVEEGCV